SAALCRRSRRARRGRARYIPSRAGPHSRPRSVRPRAWKLAEQVALGWDRDVGRATVAADVEAADDGHRTPVELAGDELRGARDLVRHGDHGRVQLVADRIVLARQVAQHLDARGADRDVGRSLPPGTAERVADDHADLTAGARAQLVAQLRS